MERFGRTLSFEDDKDVRQTSGPPARAETDDESLTALALSARDGSPAAVEAFVRAARQDVWRFIAHLTDVESADDLTQETFLRVLRSLPGFSARSSARSWVMAIARNAVVDRYRMAAVRPRKAALDDWAEVLERRRPDGIPGFEEGVALTDLLTRLPDGQREAFFLTQIIGMSYADAAEACRCPVGTVRSRVARAREQLAELLRAAESAEPGRPNAEGDSNH